MSEKKRLSRAQAEATKKYNQSKYDEIKLRVAKGEKARLQERAANAGLSLTAYLNECIHRGEKSFEKK